MKADVLPSIASSELEITRSPRHRLAPPAIPSELEIPSWVPESVTQYVRAKYAADVRRVYVKAIKKFELADDIDDDATAQWHAEQLAECEGVRATYADDVREDLGEIIWRYQALACDRRMRGVWRELSRQRRNGAPLYPTSVPLPVAVLEVFKTALECRYLQVTSTTRAEAERQRRQYLAKANELERDAIATLHHITANKIECELWTTFQAAAEACRKYAKALRRVESSLPERECDTRARAVVWTISNKFRELFASPMYGLTATITSVVLDRQINPRTVEHWCSAPPSS
jgi:hypothetical protein